MSEFEPVDTSYVDETPRPDAVLERFGLDQLPPEVREASRRLMTEILATPANALGDLTPNQVQGARLQATAMHYSGELGRALLETSTLEEIHALCQMDKIFSSEASA